MRARIFEATESITNAAVQKNFRIAPEEAPDEDTSMEEFVSSRLGGRFIAMMSDDPVAYKHAVLSEEGLPVFSSLYTPNRLLLLHVPPGTRPLKGHASSIRRHPEAYESVFHEIGTAMGSLERHDHGTLASSRRHKLIGQIAIATDVRNPHGGQIYLAPPYNFGEDDRQRVLDNLAHELVATKVVLPTQADNLVGLVREGWAHAS